MTLVSTQLFQMGDGLKRTRVDQRKGFQTRENLLVTDGTRMSTSRLLLLMAVVASGTLLVLLLASDAIARDDNPSVWVNALLVGTGVLVLEFRSQGRRERLERGIDRQHAEQDITELRAIR